jgi:hypothetical protein
MVQPNQETKKAIADLLDSCIDLDQIISLEAERIACYGSEEWQNKREEASKIVDRIQNLCGENSNKLKGASKLLSELR